jgi:hypothetical protein
VRRIQWHCGCVNFYVRESGNRSLTIVPRPGLLSIVAAPP